MKVLKILFYTLSVFFLVLGCATSQPPLEDQYPNLVKENPPNRIPYVERQVSIDSLDLVRVQKQNALLIQGTFPNPCTQILRVDERVIAEILYLDIIGWQKYQQSCAEDITPFTYIHSGISQEQWAELNTVVINDIEFEPPLAPKTE